MVNGVSTLPVPNHPAGVSITPPVDRFAPQSGQSGFVAGEENRLLAAVLQAWCGVLGQREASVDSEAWHRLSSPLVLVGPTGSGKSHLASGLAELAGGWQACFATANDLRREFAEAISKGTVSHWRERLTSVPVLLIDDVDHLPSQGSFQTELLYLARELEARGHKLVVTSAQPIAHLPRWMADLVNWFASGLTIEIAPLGVAARREVLLQIADTNGWTFTADAFDLLVEHASTEPRELFRLAADVERQFGQHARFEIDTLSHFLSRRKSTHAPELREIVRVVSRYHQIPLKSLTSASRQAAVVSARATVIYLARALTSASYEQIGQHLGGRDHTTIMHSHRQTIKRLAQETALRSAIDELTRVLRK